MSTIIAAISKALSYIGKAVLKMEKTKKEAGFARKHGPKIIIALIVSVMIPLSAVMAIFGAARDFVSISTNKILGLIGMSQEDLYECADDAGEFYTKLERMHRWGLVEDGTQDFSGNGDPIASINRMHMFMDTDTVLLIVGTVKEYNESFAKPKVFTEYRREKLKNGEWPFQVSGVTGNRLEPGLYGTEGYELEYNNVGLALIGDTAAAIGEIYPSEKDIEMKWDKGPGEKYAPMDYLQWQPVAALCCYYISMSHDDWGTYGGVKDTYYISKEKVEELMNLFAFQYEYVQEVYGNGESTRYLFDDYMNQDSVPVPFRTKVETNPPLISLEGWSLYRDTHRIPAWAPHRISNSYIEYNYSYEVERENAVDGGYVEYARVSSVAYKAQPSKLIEAMKEKIPYFNMDVYMRMLKMFPKSESSVDYFNNVILAEGNDEPFEDVTTDPEVSPTINVVVGKRQYEQFKNGGLPFGGISPESGTSEVPLYAASGMVGSTNLSIKPHPDIVRTGQSYGSYQVRNDAHQPLDVSDNLSLEQLQKLLNSASFLSNFRYNESPVLCNESVRNELAKCLYDYQMATGSSVTGVLGLLAQEGGFTSSYAKKGYNYFHIKVGSSQEFEKIGSSGFRDYKKALEAGVIDDSRYQEPAVKAFAKQVDWVYNNYWNRSESKGGKQNTFYSMIFKGYARAGSQGLDAYKGISHSYCPPWDDPAMPYSNDSYTSFESGGSVTVRKFWTNSSARNAGWVNNCARFRALFYQAATQ